MRSLVVVSLLVMASNAHAKQHAKRPHHAIKPKVTVAIHGPIVGQSVGAPWEGRLRDPARLPDGDGYHIRRPWRSFGTRTTVDYVLSAITNFRAQFPDAHVLAIGDLSQKDGGQITEHHSHQSGRDADIGLIYKHQPPAYPASFVTATDDNLDCEATYALVNEFAQTAHSDGGALVMFLDYHVQGLLYQWAKAHDIDDATLEKLFQYPHRGESGSLVRHEPNHDNHLHVRFKCPRGDSACR